MGRRAVDPTEPPELRPLKAMMRALPKPAAEQLYRVLVAALQAPPPTPAEERRVSMTYLAEMIDEELARREPGDGRPPRVPRCDYDATKPDHAAESKWLVRKFGSWLKACRAANALTPDELGEREGKAWATRGLGGRRGKDYSRDEVSDAVFEVARRMHKEPLELTSHAYYTYVAEMRRRAHERGTSPPRWPTQRSVERFFDSWGEVRAALPHDRCRRS